MSVSDPYAIVTGAGAQPQLLRWRALGGPGDLDLDLNPNFNGSNRPEQVTRVLAQCLRGVPQEKAEEIVWRLTLAARVGGLAAIVAHSFDTPTLAAHLSCGSCGQEYEIDLPLPELMQLAQSAERETIIAADMGAEQRLSLRRPTGADQRQWRSLAFASREQAETHILASLASSDDQVPPSDRAALTALAQLMEERDPLSAFQVNSTCPACGGDDEQPLDLEAMLLQRLAGRRQAMIAEMHRLASRYGWSEAEILAVPAQRRSDYLRLIERDAERP